MAGDADSRSHTTPRQSATAGQFQTELDPRLPQGSHEAELFEIETDAGITGVTASPSFAGGLDYVTPRSLFLQGKDPHDVEGIVHRLETVDLMGPRPWHLELAL